LSHLPISRRTYQTIKDVAIELADKVEDLDLCPENMPPSLAAGVIALVISFAKIPIGNDAIAKVCEVSEGTLNKCLKKLEAAVKTNQLEIPSLASLTL
jgi:transcription initiation factor TFIIIB Brf1 subunit/transcription initiation factor TFIIB